MTSKERVHCVLDFRKPDRVPRFDSFWSEFHEKWRQAKGLGGYRYSEEIKRYREEHEDIRVYYGIDVGIEGGDASTFPGDGAELKRDGKYVIYRDRWGRVVKTAPNAAFYEQLESPIKKKSDLDRMVFKPVDLDDRYVGYPERVARKSQKRCVFCKVGGPYQRTTFIRGEAEFLMDIAGDEAFARELARRTADHQTGIGLEELRRGNLYDTGVWIYDDFADNRGPMMSPGHFERIFYPQFKRMIHAFREAGARNVCLHCDGNILPVLDLLLDAGIDGINPVEPKAGMDVVKLREQYGNRLALLGGMCNTFVLPGSDKGLIEKETRRVLEVSQDGGVVIGAHSIGPDIPVENYDLYHRILEEYG